MLRTRKPSARTTLSKSLLNTNPQLTFTQGCRILARQTKNPKFHGDRSLANFAYRPSTRQRFGFKFETIYRRNSIRYHYQTKSYARRRSCQSNSNPNIRSLVLCDGQNQHNNTFYKTHRTNNGRSIAPPCSGDKKLHSIG